jgi:hypothetical protein
MDSSFKRVEKSSLKDFNLEEARGWIIDRMIQIEILINSILIKYFQPNKEKEFQGIMLHTSIISLGSKLKVLKGLNIIDNKTSTNIHKLLNIRNTFAHSSVIPNISIVVGNIINQPTQIVSITDEIEVMNSNGDVKQNNAREYLNEFWELNKEVGNALRNIKLEKTSES